MERLQTCGPFSFSDENGRVRLCCGQLLEPKSLFWSFLCSGVVSSEALARVWKRSVEITKVLTFELSRWTFAPESAPGLSPERTAFERSGFWLLHCVRRLRLGLSLPGPARPQLPAALPFRQ